MMNEWRRLASVGLFEVEWARLAIGHARPGTPAPASAIEALRSPGPALSVMAKYLGDAFATSWVVAEIRSFSNCVNASAGLNDYMLATLARIIRQTYYFLKPEEIAFAFHRALLGAYGKFYSNLDVPTVLGILKAYDDERVDVAKAVHEEGVEPVGEAPYDHALACKNATRARQLRERMEAAATDKRLDRALRKPRAERLHDLAQVCAAWEIDYGTAHAHLLTAIRAEWEHHGGRERAEAVLIDWDGFAEMRADQWVVECDKLHRAATSSTTSSYPIERHQHRQP